MWTWIKTEFRYHKIFIFVVFIGTILIPLLSVPILRLFEANSHMQRSVMTDFVMLAIIPWTVMTYYIRKDIRHENRALLLARGVSRRGMAGGRILMNVLPTLDIAISMLFMGWLAGFTGIAVSLPGMLVFMLMFVVMAIYWVIMDHFAEVNQEYLKSMGLMIPLFVPFFWYLNEMLFDSFDQSTPLYIELANWPTVLILLGIGLLCTQVIFWLSQTRWSLRPLVANRGVSVG